MGGKFVTVVGRIFTVVFPTVNHRRVSGKPLRVSGKPLVRLSDWGLLRGSQNVRVSKLFVPNFCPLGLTPSFLAVHDNFFLIFFFLLYYFNSLLDERIDIKITTGL